MRNVLFLISQSENSQSNVDALIAAAQVGGAAEIRRLLQSIVPEYQPAESIVEPTPQIANPAKITSALVSVQPIIRRAEG